MGEYGLEDSYGGGSFVIFLILILLLLSGSGYGGYNK